ncbi:MAG: hypothetical protein FWC26_10995 [Fibromonadales bacterium]|nr:hypothetical protein [Fibromonadales bacterium]
MKQISKILIIPGILVLTSCAPFKAQAPGNFAEYTDTSSDAFKAVSADGILYRVSEYDQEAEASLDFWREAFLLKMKNANYKQEESLNISLGGKPAIGYVFSFANNTGLDSYLVAAVQHKEKMFVVEAAGESVKFENRKKEILDAINKININ